MSFYDPLSFPSVVSFDLDEDNAFYTLEERLAEMNRDNGMKILVTKLPDGTGRKLRKAETRDFDESEELLRGLEDLNPDERLNTIRDLAAEFEENIGANLGPN